MSFRPKSSNRRFRSRNATRPQPSPEAIGAKLEASQIRLKPEALQKLWNYHELLRRRNHDRDLTRITGFEDMVMKHYVDCMIVGNLHRLPSPLLDVGTGAGFPGIPLKIRYPHLEIVLAEPRPRRVQFLREVIETLGLRGIEVFDHKVVSRSFKRPMAGIITRALETMDKTILRTSACLGEGCELVFMKGPSVDEGLREVHRRFRSSVRTILDKNYQLQGTPHRRRLIVMEKLVAAEVSNSDDASLELDSPYSDDLSAPLS